jgi:plastocyanin
MKAMEAARSSPVRRLLLLMTMTALVAALGGGIASPAMAESQQVQVTDFAFVTPAVAIKPGESVTWTYAANTDRHNVMFDEDPFVSPPEPSPGPWTATRTFPQEGVYRYHCHEHGEPGEGMSGVVYVNATGTVPGLAPAASFTLSPSLAQTGQAVSFDGSASSDPDDRIIRYEWDRDGNGSYETDSGRRAVTSASYPNPGSRTVKLRVTDYQGHTAEATRALQVNPPPGPPPTTTTASRLAALLAAKRAKAVKRCKRKYSSKKARTPSKKRRMAKRRKACIRRAKKLRA